MSLRILFADDSVTAQNMGKKILTEAGYEVVAVSNGAAAVKKIAEQKPDIIILDVYMPGYSGLEVCEKVRNSIETVKTPVLLTVGKMEPYKPEDVNRVKADGVIVKPFEASDLLAVMKKFEERIVQTLVKVPQPVLVDRFQAEEIAESPMELPVEQPISSTVHQPMVEVPDHMATTSAFSDLLGPEPPVPVNHFEPPPPPVVQEAPDIPVTVRGAIPDYELPVSWREEEAVVVAEPPPPPPPRVEPILVRPVIESAPEPIPPPAPLRPLQIPVYQEREPSAQAYEFMPTSVPPTGEIEIPREPELQETAAEATRNTLVESVEPGLLTTRQQFESTPEAMAAAEMAPVEEQFAPAGFQDIPAEIASHLPPPVMEVAPPPTMEVAPPPPLEQPSVDLSSDNDFEIRVAAAMSAYAHSQEAASAPSHPPVQDFAAAPPDAVDEPAIIPVPTDALPAEVSAPPEEATEADAQPKLSAVEPPVAVVEYPPIAGVAADSPAVEASNGLLSEDLPSEVAQTAVLPEEPVHSFEPPVPIFEYHPPVDAAPEAPVAENPASEAAEAAPAVTQPEPEASAVVELTAAVEAPAAVESSLPEPPAPVAVAIVHHEATAAIEADLPAQVVAAAAAAGTATGADHHSISQAVHRVMERLKPELVEEILRELKSKKE